MDSVTFEKMLHEKIPITEAMAFHVLEFSSLKVRITAELAPNANHMQTAFGGSINCLMVTCGWSMMNAIFQEIDPTAHIVIQRSSIEYYHPIKHDFVAECNLQDESKLVHLKDMYRRHNKGKQVLEIFCYEGETLLAKFEGQFVAYK